MPANFRAAFFLQLRAMNDKKWEAGEKRFLFGALLALLFFLGSTLWWGRFNEVPEIEIPTPKMPSPNAYDTYQQALWAMPLLPQEAVDPLFERRRRPDAKTAARRYTLARQEAFLKSNAAALKIFRRGLKQPFMAPPIRSFGQMFAPNPLWNLRDLANLVALQAKVQAARGQWNQAAQSALDVVQFSHQTQQGTSYYFGFQSSGFRDLRAAVPHLNATDSKNAARRLEKIYATRTHYWQITQEQKWMMLSALRDEMRHPDWANRITQTWGGTRSPVDNWARRFETKRSVLDEFTRYYDTRIAEAKKPYAKMQDVKPPSGRFASVIFNYTIGGAERFWHARSGAGVTLFTTLMALRAYRLERGAYPENLNQLVPNYLSTIPADPFGSGEALRYQKRGDSFTLWSIGPDGRDNKGQAIKNPPRGYSYYYGEVDSGSAPADATARGDWIMGPKG
jgi:hypothetical protein